MYGDVPYYIVNLLLLARVAVPRDCLGIVNVSFGCGLRFEMGSNSLLWRVRPFAVDATAPARLGPWAPGDSKCAQTAAE